MASEVTEERITINGFELIFKQSGKGFPLVLIHTHHPYAKYFLSTLPKKVNYQAITIDIPGYYSAKQKKAIETIDQFNDLLQKLFAQIGFKQVDLMGECLGSIIALKFAAKYPQKVRKLIVISSPLRIFDPKIKKTVGPLFTFLKKYRIAGSIAKFLMRLNLWRGLTDYLGGYHGFWGLFKQETLLVSKWNFDQRVFWGVLSDLLETDIKKILQNLKSETLFVIGGKDRVTKKKEIIKFCQKNKNASYALIPKANHALVITHTKQFNQIVQKFLLKS